MNISQFENICRKDQKSLKKYVKSKLKIRYDKVVCRDGYIYAQGDFPVLLVAHLDTVHKSVPKVIVHNGGCISSPQGIGGDDRCGVYAILQIINKYKCSVLFTEDEEIGGIGADKFCIDKFSESLVGTFNYIIELDRKGRNDAVFYDCDNKEFTKFITSAFWKKNYGSFSDISYVAPHLKAAAVNLSCGYFNAHTASEYVEIESLDECVRQVTALLERTDDTKYEYVEAARMYGWSMYGYCDPYDDPYGYGDYGYYDSYLHTYEIGFMHDGVESVDHVDADSKYEALGMFFEAYPTTTYSEVMYVEKIHRY